VKTMQIKELIKAGKICPICHSEEHLNGECEKSSSYENIIINKETLFK
jgi:hypothetical protein